MIASKNPLIPDLLADEQEQQKLKLILTEILTTSRLRRASIHMPSYDHQRGSINKVVTILQKRILDPQKNPPLRIAVFGGSVTIGRNCFGNFGTMCAWPKRLELLINQFFNKELVKVYNLGIGGTNTAVATNMIKYWIYPKELKTDGPDVIINSYSTNDSLPSYKLKDDPNADLVNIVMDQVRARLQSFIRTALQSNRCDISPLVVHVDDYLGPQQESLLGEMSYNTAMT
jgi:hypothetical protein